jgi:4-hydroxybenzoate polyprenyltransferase
MCGENMLQSVKSFARLGRSQTAVLTGLTPLLGAVASGHTPSWRFLPLFFIGIGGHLFGFSMNEIVDLPVDRLSSALSDKPLVKGEICPHRATVFAIGTLLFSYGTGTVFFHSPMAMIVLFLSALFSVMYNMCGKRIPFMDVFLAASIGLLAMYGAIALHETSDTFPAARLTFFRLQQIAPVHDTFTRFLSKNGVSMETLIIGLLLALQLLVQNITAGLKDIIHDRNAGATTVPVIMGVHTSNSGEIAVTPSFYVLCAAAKGIRTVAILVSALCGTAFRTTGPQISVIVVLDLTSWILWLKLTTFSPAQRTPFLRTLAQHEIVSFLAIAVMLYTFTGYSGIAFLVFFPSLWAIVFLFWLYGGKLPNV